MEFVKLLCWKVARLTPLVLLIRAVTRSRRVWIVAAVVLMEKIKHTEKKNLPQSGYDNP